MMGRDRAWRSALRASAQRPRISARRSTMPQAPPPDRQPLFSCGASRLGSCIGHFPAPLPLLSEASIPIISPFDPSPRMAMYSSVSVSVPNAATPPVPSTCNGAPGVLVPIPTFPLASMMKGVVSGEVLSGINPVGQRRETASALARQFRGGREAGRTESYGCVVSPTPSPFPQGGGNMSGCVAREAAHTRVGSIVAIVARWVSTRATRGRGIRAVPASLSQVSYQPHGAAPIASAIRLAAARAASASPRSARSAKMWKRAAACITSTA